MGEGAGVKLVVGDGLLGGTTMAECAGAVGEGREEEGGVER